MPKTYIKDKTIASKLYNIGKKFNITDPLFSCEEITMGNINHTYKVEYAVTDENGMINLKPYLFQNVNTFAFKNPSELMYNIDLVTEHIRSKKDGTCLHYHHSNSTGERLNYYQEGKECWRVCNYIESDTCDTTKDLELIRNTGKAFGEFQTLLSDFDASKLYYSIPDFHNTRKRYDALIEEVFNDTVGRVKEVRDELNYLMSVRDKACTLIDLYNNGKIPLRVTHNDTKINNVLFDKETKAPLSVVDLDTVMPGVAGNDFGDAIRFCANQVEEDSKKTELVALDLNIFWAFTEGFLSQTANSFTEAEFDSFAISSFCITCELATRFLTDYISGDKYFKIKYPDHNLVRARCQIALAKDMERKMEAMEAIVHGCKQKFLKK